MKVFPPNKDTPYDLRIIDDESIEDKSVKLQHSFLCLCLLDSNNQDSLKYLSKCKINFKLIDLTIQDFFFKSFEKLIKGCYESIDKENDFQGDDFSFLNRLISYLEILNNTSYDVESFRRRLKLETSICDVLFAIMDKILQKEKTDERISTGFISVIELLSKSFHDYNKDWKGYNTIMLILRLANKIDKFSFRMKCLNIIRNIYDYDEEGDDSGIDFEVDKHENKENRLKKRKLAIDFILKCTDVAILIKSKLFLKAIRYIAVNTEHENFELLHDDEERRLFVGILVNFMKYNYTYAIESIKKVEILTFTNEEQAQILKRISFINYINFFITSYYSLKSYEFSTILIGSTSGLDFIFNVLQNDIVHDIISKYKADLIYSAYTRTIATAVAILSNVKYLRNQFKNIWMPFSNSNIFYLSKSLVKFNVNPQIIFNIIPFFCQYEDDDDEKTIDLLKETRMYNEAFKIFNSVETAQDLFSKRSVLNAISKFFPNASEFQRQDSDPIKIFIKISIEFIKYGHSIMTEDLQLYNPESNEYQDSIDRLIKMNYFLRLILITIQNVADKSIAFGILFHENPTENGVKELLDFASDQNILQKLIKYQTNSVVNLIATSSYRAVYGTLNNLSKAAYKFRDIWSSLNAFSILLSCGNKTNSIDNYFQIVSFMTIGNIASEDDLNNFSSSLSILETIMKKVKEFSTALSDNSKMVYRDLFQISEVDTTRHEIMAIKGWNFFEVMEAINNFSVNDNIKGLIYETLKMKDYLRVFIYNGNHIEQEISFKVLNQLCFDKKIAQDVIDDKELVELMKVKLGCEEKSASLVKYLEGILWIVNESQRKESDGKSGNLQHIFISYNHENQVLCQSIKKRLEAFGYKIWIDVENMKGSTIEAMATAIEQAWCVLVCMTEKYKESTNCRFEAEYVIRLNKPFIPLIMQKKYRPDGWLGLVLGTKMYIDFTKYDFEDSINKLKKEIEGYGNKIENKEELVEESIPISIVNNQVQTDQTITIEMSKKSALLWTESDVENWLNYKSIPDCIKQNILPCNGHVLEQLYKMLKEVPEFFYSTLRSDTNANLRDIAFFTTELNSLFSNNLKK